MLNFIEYAFGTNDAYLSQYGISQSSSWQYADYLAMDAKPTCPTCAYSLEDFFNFSSAGYHSFEGIQGAKYQPSCFHVPSQTGCFKGTYPQDADDDEIESSD
ncbi:MAG TPA: hypothetical protein VF753_15135 [Terriglobales bacterium]